MSKSTYPSIPDPTPDITSLYQSVTALKAAYETLIGTRGTQSVVDNVDLLLSKALPYNSDASSMTSGYNITTYRIPVATGVIRLDARNGLVQRLTNSSITEIYAPFYDGAFVLLVQNLVSTPVIVWNDFAGGNHGSPLTTNPGEKFMIWITRIDGVASYWVQALQ